MIKKQY